jgi:transcriptional regulator with XRE-family HTH domain
MKTNETHRTIAAGLLVDARRRAGLTQAEVASRAGVSRPSISQYENGRKDPSVSMLDRLIEACGMELRLRADPHSPASRGQALRDDTVGPAQAQRNAKRARAGLVGLRPLTAAEKTAARG